MTDYTVIAAVSQTLRDLLEDHITNHPDPGLNGVPIDLRSPKEMRDDQDATGVSLWLYRVVRNGDLLNYPPRRPTPAQQSRQPLPIDLHYLVTPIANDPRDEQALMGRVIQAFNDHAALRGSDLQGTLELSGQELRLNMEPMSLEEITRVWSALQESYQLSVSYQVQLVGIESDHEHIQTTPVLVKETTYTQILEVT